MIADENACPSCVLQLARPAVQEISRLDDCDLWVTLEPCTMRSRVAHARLRRVYFGAFDEKAGAMESGVRFFDQPSCHHRPEIYGGLSAAAAADLLRAFFRIGASFWRYLSETIEPVNISNGVIGSLAG